MDHEQASEIAQDADAASDPSETASKKILESRVFKDGAIYLFIRSDYKKRTWFCRIKVPNSKGYVWRSTKTTNEHQAYAFAETLYNKTLVRVLGGESPNAKRFGPVIEAYQRHLEPTASQQSVHNRLLLFKRITPFLRNMTVESADTSLISSIIGEITRLSSKDRLSPNTVRRVSSDLKHFFNWAVDQGHIPVVPRFPKVAGDAARRTHFDDTDWRKLVRHLREFIKHENAAVRRDRSMLIDYVLILGNTGIRVGEARTLKWRDIRQLDNHTGPPDIVLAVTGKTGAREVVARTSDVKKYLQRIYRLRQSELVSDDDPSPTLSPDSLVFCHSDGSPVKSFKKSFQSLIKSAGVETNSTGQTRTIYSLRHTYATFRLHQGVHQFTLARNMGTSVAMLEQYYGHTSNITSAGELTKSVSGRRAGGNAASLDWLK